MRDDGIETLQTIRNMNEMTDLTTATEFLRYAGYKKTLRSCCIFVHEGDGESGIRGSVVTRGVSAHDVCMIASTLGSFYRILAFGKRAESKSFEGKCIATIMNLILATNFVNSIPVLV